MNQVNGKTGRKISQHWYTGKVIAPQARINKDKVCSITQDDPIKLESWEELVSFKWNKERSCGYQIKQLWKK